MKSVSFLLSPISSLASRLRRARPGSVLIIVIVLLLLLAILGAAYISTTRSARVSSAQNVLNSDVGTMINGIAKVCEGLIVDDMNDTFGNLRGNSANTNNTAITNRSYFQGAAMGPGANKPNINLNVPGGAANPVFQPGDIVSCTKYGNGSGGMVYFYDPLGGTAGNPVDVSTPGGKGWQVMNGGLPFTAPGATPWLAERIPDSAGINTALWNAISQTVLNQVQSGGATTLTPGSVLGTRFEDPTVPFRVNAGTIGTNGTFVVGVTTPLVCGMPGGPTPLVPTYLNTANGWNVAANGPSIPALQMFGGGSNTTTWAAGDADGDGIADSLLFRIPGANYDGLSWFAAVRIVDNNSAINANTAWSRDSLTFASGVADVWNLFQTSVGLQEVAIQNTDNFATFNAYREGTGYTNGVNVLDDAPVYGNTAPSAFNRTTGAGSPADLKFVSQADSFYHQLIRRINNPGYNDSGTARYQAFPLSDEASLAYQFCLQNPSSLAQSLLESRLPNSLTKNVASSPYDASNVGPWFTANFSFGATDAMPNLRPFLVTRNGVSNAIQQVYNNDPNSVGGQTFSSDPLLPLYMLPYSANTTAGATAPHFRGEWSDKATYAVGDVVVFPGPTPPSSVVTTYAPKTPYQGPSYTFVCVAAVAPSTTPPAALNANNVVTAINQAVWHLQSSFTKNPVKANVNTASFPELFRAFWCVMAGNPSDATPFGITPIDTNNIYDNTYDPTAGAGNPQAEFRSVLRDPLNFKGANVSLLDAPPVGGGSGTDTNVMLLRAALAAVDTLGLRDNSQNVISRTIVLNKPSQIDNAGVATQATVELQVFSNAPQPVFSEIYVNTYTGADPNDASIVNSQGYVAIELYNPYSVPMVLNNWQLGLINRTATAGTAPNNLIYPNLSFETETTTPLPSATPSVIGPIIQAQNDPRVSGGGMPAPGVIIVPAHGFALLENYNPATGATPNPGDALGRPANANFLLTAGGMVQKGVWYGPGGTAAPNTCDVYVQNLQLAIAGTTGSTITGTSTGGEVVLLRPRRSDGNLSNSTDPQNTFTEGAFTVDPVTFKETITAINLYDLVPVDSYDFSGLPIGSTSAGVAWSYIRQKCQQTATTPPTPTLDPSVWFKCFFPAFYSTNVIAGSPREGASTTTPGTGTLGITSATPNPTWTQANAAPLFGMDSATGSYTNNYPPIQVFNVSDIQTIGATDNHDSMHFPNSVVSPLFNPGTNPTNPYVTAIVPTSGTATNTPPFLFPHGGFARNGDMLDIPFIGAYRIRIASGPLVQTALGSQTFLEMNALPKDCSFAAVETNLSGEDAAQNVGRFVPMAATYTYFSAFNTGKFTDGTSATPPLPDYYSWTRNLFNYLTVQSPSDAHTPDFDPNYSSSNPALGLFAYPPQNSTAPQPIGPTPTLTGDATATDQSAQDNVGVEGLININTASWKVLSLLPFVPGSTPGNVLTNQTIAKNIVNYRLTHGPFTSIFDLNQVPGFQTGNGTFDPTKPTTGAVHPSSSLGLLSPADPNFGTTAPPGTAPPLGDVEDYQDDCLTLTRISNLITTRSDTFTVYIEVQGWQNAGQVNPNAGAAPPAGTPIPQPVITRRYSFIVDRSAINADPTSRYLKTLTVPNN